MATETIEIFKLEIDLDAAVQAASDLKSESNSLSKELAALKKAGDTSSNTYVKLKGELDNVNKEYRESQKQVQQITSLQGKNIGTVKEARTALSLVGKQWAAQAKLYGENSKEVVALGKKKLELTNRLKELESATGDTSRNVGNYTESIGNALAKNTIFSKGMAIVNQVVSVAKPLFKTFKLQLDSIAVSYTNNAKAAAIMSGAQKRAAITTNLLTTALKLFKIALIATGIGAFLVILGSVVAFFSKTQKGVDQVNVVLAVLGAAFDVIIDRLSAFGSAVLKLFSGDIKGGFADMKTALSGIGDELEREISLAAELERAFQRMKDQEIGLILVQAERKKRVEELRILAKDELTDLNERANLLQQAGDIEKQVLADELALAREAARISQERLDLGESTREQIKENAELQAAVTEKEIASLKLQRSLEAEKQGLLKRARAEAAANAKAAETAAKKATAQAIKDNQTFLKLFIEQNKGRVDTLEKGLFDLQVIMDESLAIEKQRLDAGLINETEYQLAVLKIKNTFLEDQTALTIEFAGRELDIYRSNNQSRIEDNQLLTQALVNEEQTRLDLLAEQRREFERVRLEEGVITQQEYNEAINTVNEENRLAKEEIDLQLKEQQAEQDAIDFENEQALRVERDGLIFEAKLAQLERDKKAEIDKAKKVGADTAKIEQIYANQTKLIKQQEADFKLSIAADTFGNLATILGKESKAGKAAAIAQATISTFQSAVNSYNSLSSIPVVGPALGAIAAAAAIASGIAQVKKITSTPEPVIPKAEQGALFGVGGKRHSQGGTKFYGEDGTKFEAEKGELIGVMNRRAASHFMNFNDRFKQGSGGPAIGNYFQDGGTVQRALSSGGIQVQSQPGGAGLNIDELAAKLAAANAELPAPIVAVEDINTGQGRFAEVVEGANA